MNPDSIRWTSIGREDIPTTLLGDIRSVELIGGSFPNSHINAGRIAVGYAPQAKNSHYRPPSLLVIEDDAAAETLSWVRTFASEFFPLSQFVRVVLKSDWDAVINLELDASSGAQQSDRWASVVIGEALAQGDSEIELQNLSAARLSGCFSMAVARATLIYGLGEFTRSCVNRIKQVETDRRFSRRAITVDNLFPAWTVASAQRGVTCPAGEAAILVFENALKFPMSTQEHQSADLILREIRDSPRLHSDSIEERVLAFQRLSREIFNRAMVPRSNLADVALAAAAFLVGRSTSHHFLLREFTKIAPLASVWFGVIAAWTGPEGWDQNWLRATKGAERLLRADFEWLQVPTADVGWGEYWWLSSHFGPGAFLELPKMLPRTLSVEIVPGATFQVRLAGGAAEGDARPPESSMRERMLRDAVQQFVNLAQNLQGVLDGDSSHSSSSQQWLGLVNEPSHKIGQRTKRSRKGS